VVTALVEPLRKMCAKAWEMFEPTASEQPSARPARTRFDIGKSQHLSVFRIVTRFNTHCIYFTAIVRPVLLGGSRH